MVERHDPTERFTVAGEAVGVECDTCYSPWPCPAVVALRDYKERRSDEVRRSLSRRQKR
jgi:hypothetical protein